MAAMLDGMDLPSTAAWVVLGAVLGILLAGAVVAWMAAVRGRAVHRARHTAEVPPPVDDLADFLEHPPGTRPEPAASGWFALAPQPPAPGEPVRDEPRDGRRRLAPVALCVAGLVVVGAIASLATGRAPVDEPAPQARETPQPAAPDARDDDVAAVLTFEGLVLEPRAVGITAAYPEVTLTGEGDAARLDVRLPTYNCLTRDAPADPLAAGCAAAAVEHGSLGPDEVRLERDGDRWLVEGRLATSLPSGGSGPVPTGRAYDLELTVSPGDGSPEAGWRSAVGRLRLGTGTSTTIEVGSRLRTD